MARPSFAIDVVESGYRLEGSEDEWFGRVLGELAPELDRGLGTMAITYHFDGERLVFDRLVGRGCPDHLLQFTRAMYENVTPEAARELCTGAGAMCALSEFMRRVPAEVRGGIRDAFAKLGISDTLLVGYPDGDGGWITFASITAEPIRTFAPQRQIWTRICAHLATAWRLRTRIGTARAAAEAVLSLSGKVLSAEGGATGKGARERLQQAAKDIDRARGSLRRRDPMAAIDLWKGLVSGRWSLVDRVDERESTMLIAHKNDPTTPDPRGLSPRERAIVELALTGTSNKNIAYTLGLSPGTVAGHLQQALAKLRIKSRVELMRLGAGAAAQAPRAGAGDTEIGMLVVDKGGEAHAALTDAEDDVARLVADGLTNVEIAERRGSAERTVVNQIAAIYEKLGIGSRAELVLALLRGWKRR
jgi:DNA-binding NarL/FixJ family response regulator